MATRPHGFFELHLVRAWHAQAAESFAGPFRSGHPPKGIEARVGCLTNGLPTFCAPSGFPVRWRGTIRVSMLRAEISPFLLRWARDSAGLPFEVLASRFAKVGEWEAARTGNRLTRAVLASNLEAQTLFRDAMHMLGIWKVETFHKLGQ